MGRAITIRTDQGTAADLRRIAKQQSRRRTALRLLAIANAMEGMSRAQAARSVGIERQSLCDAIKRFNDGGLQEALVQGSRRPRTVHAAFPAERAERLREMLHRSPREFDKPTGLWTLELAAEASFEEGITEGRVSGETVRAALARMGVRWLRAKRWITSPDPEYARKKGAATG